MPALQAAESCKDFPIDEVRRLLERCRNAGAQRSSELILESKDLEMLEHRHGDVKEESVRERCKAWAWSIGSAGGSQASTTWVRVVDRWSWRVVA